VIYDNDLVYSGLQIVGPAIIEDFNTSIIIPPGMKAVIDEYGNTIIDIHFSTEH
jgi:N-methylhydantoinase A